MSDDTIFDKVLRGDVPSKKVYEDESIYAFRDVHPQAPVHVLVIPRKKLASFAEVADADPADIAAFVQGISRVARALGLEESGYRVVFNTGPDAQQSVHYLHAHIIAGRKLGWPPG
jgi:histidine triad (HIT) family protein